MCLRVFNNEPTARMAEQRLQQEGVPCMVRSLLGGPGLWGTAYNLPHELLVYEGDEMMAREVLELAPQEMIEREREWEREGQKTPAPMPQWIVTATIIAVVAFIALTVVIADRAIR